jgi:hypothetical protein
MWRSNHVFLCFSFWQACSVTDLLSAMGRSASAPDRSLHRTPLALSAATKRTEAATVCSQHSLGCVSDSLELCRCLCLSPQSAPRTRTATTRTSATARSVAVQTRSALRASRLYARSDATWRPADASSATTILTARITCSATVRRHDIRYPCDV